MQTIWRPVVGFEGLYEVSNTGKVRSVNRIVIRGGRKMRLRGTTLRGRILPTGYRYVNLYKDSRQTGVGVHRVVAAAFVPNPEGKPEVGHRDNRPGYNHASNLVWCTRLENQAHAGAQVRFRGKLTPAQIEEIRATWPTLKYGEQSALAARYGITAAHVWRIGTRRAHRHFAPELAA